MITKTKKQLRYDLLNDQSIISEPTTYNILKNLKSYKEMIELAHDNINLQNQIYYQDVYIKTLERDIKDLQEAYYDLQGRYNYLKTYNKISNIKNNKYDRWFE
jgi:gas vesicle protein